MSQLNWILNGPERTVAAVDVPTMTLLSVRLIGEPEDPEKYKWSVWREEGNLNFWGFTDSLEMAQGYAEAAHLLGREYYRHILGLPLGKVHE